MSNQNQSSGFLSELDEACASSDRDLFAKAFYSLYQKLLLTYAIEIAALEEELFKWNTEEYLIARQLMEDIDTIIKVWVDNKAIDYEKARDIINESKQGYDFSSLALQEFENKIIILFDSLKIFEMAKQFEMLSHLEILPVIPESFLEKPEGFYTRGRLKQLKVLEAHINNVEYNPLSKIGTYRMVYAYIHELKLSPSWISNLEVFDLQIIRSNFLHLRLILSTSLKESKSDPSEVYQINGFYKIDSGKRTIADLRNGKTNEQPVDKRGIAYYTLLYIAQKIGNPRANTIEVPVLELNNFLKASLKRFETKEVNRLLQQLRDAFDEWPIFPLERRQVSANGDNIQVFLSRK